MEEITEDQNEKGDKVNDYKGNIVKSVRRSTKSGKGKMQQIKKMSMSGSAYEKHN